MWDSPVVWLVSGYIGEPPHVGLVALANFYELEVAANDLVIGCIAIPELDDFSILADLERAHGLIRMEVSLAGLGFHHLVGAVGQSPGVRLGNTVHHLDGGAHLAGLVERATHIHRILGFICDFK